MTHQDKVTLALALFTAVTLACGWYFAEKERNR